MFELIKSMAFALIMVPVVMAVILGLIYGLGELFNFISKNESKNLERKL
ncbi:AcrZ family multidrug efflux pump-associated protein [Xenorhabdus siamensis]